MTKTKTEITDATMLISDDWDAPCSWRDFEEANRDMANDDPEWLSEILQSLSETGKWREGIGGGGFIDIRLA